MADIKTAADLYNSIVDMTKKTGQGIPMFIVDKLGKHAELDQLKKLELVEVLTEYYGTLPDDVTIVIKGVYSAYRDDNLSQGLIFLRRWLNHDQSKDIPFSHVSSDGGETYRDSKEVYNEWRIDSKDDYVKWISDNLEELEAIPYLTHKTDAELLTFMISDITKGSEIHEYLTSRGWYKDNLLIDECVVRSLSGIDNKREKKGIIKELLSLCSRIHDDEHDKMREDYTEQNDTVSKEISFAKSLLVMLKSSTEPDKETVQEFFNL
tara:strand:+ start:2167 stop:2961 length:795 start_codon:yes stop_codon:yes gene_type:complete